MVSPLRSRRSRIPWLWCSPAGGATPSWRLLPSCPHNVALGLAAASLAGIAGIVSAAASGAEHAPVRSEAGAAAQSRAESIPAPDTTRQNALGQRIQHGFVGDLSRPAPPAINRIDGVRIPGTPPPASIPATPSSAHSRAAPATDAAAAGDRLIPSPRVVDTDKSAPLAPKAAPPVREPE